MNLIIFSDSKTTGTYYKKISGKRGMNLEVYPSRELKKRIKGIDKNAFVYVDISAYNDKESDKIIRYLSRYCGVRYGIFDPKGMIQDVAILFFGGASDYIGKDILKKALTLTRLKKAAAFHAHEMPVAEEISSTATPSKVIPSGSKWGEIRSGQEYTFILMYVELDHHEELRKNLGEDLVHAVTASFKKYIEKVVTNINGRVWIWNDFSGLILFPFNGKSCDAVITCFKLILNRKLICVEELPFMKLFSFHIALHIGNTVYKQKGKTGTLVSDTINSIFHLGRKFARPGNFYLTTEAYEFVPEKLHQFFVPAGSFEGSEIMRMLLPF